MVLRARSVDQEDETFRLCSEMGIGNYWIVFGLGSVYSSTFQAAILSNPTFGVTER